MLLASPPSVRPAWTTRLLLGRLHIHQACHRVPRKGSRLHCTMTLSKGNYNS